MFSMNCVESRAQLVHQLFHLFLVAPALQRLHQLVLRRAQPALRLGQVAVLDIDGDVPEQVRRALQRRGVFIVRQPPVGAADAEIDRGVADEHLRRDGQRIEGARHLVLQIRPVDQLLALLDQRAGERLVEFALRQHQRMGFAFTDLSGLVAGFQRNRRRQPGPEMRGQIAVGLAVALLGVGAGQRQRNDRGLAEPLDVGGALFVLVASASSPRAITAWADSTP